MSETSTLTLADFLLARIAEDRKWCSRLHVQPVGNPTWSPDSISRVLAECEAKRRIVEIAQRGEGDWAAGSVMIGHRVAGRDILRALALPYADHADYHEEWRP